jgi:hypothetical protein
MWATDILTQDGKKICTESCRLNPYWDVLKEVIWFCPRCTRWYHIECCKTEAVENTGLPSSCAEWMRMPMLMGGALGLLGTAAIAVGAAELIRDEGGDTEISLEQLGAHLNMPLDRVVPKLGSVEVAKLMNQEVWCPACEN